MKKLLLPIALLIAAGFAACSDDDDNDVLDFNSVEVTAALENYADIVQANYQDARTEAVALQTAVDNFVANPSESTMTAAKDAWLEAREAYGQTEAFRFYGGPIDDDDGPEGQLNAWPLDESFIDYVNTASNGDGSQDGTNIINSPNEFPTISKELIAAQNENGGETNVSSGYHAVEFLLWGQDESTGAGGGERPFTDYVTDGSGTNDNQVRRGAYLKEATDLIIDDLDALIAEWSTNGNYRSFFTQSSEAANSLERILNGIGKLSKGELAGERMFVAWDLRSKEDEHSCFSDNTHRDIVTNAQGIENVYLGTYRRTDGSVVSGTGIYDVLALRNQALADEIKELMVNSTAATEAIQAPFDQEFLSEPGRTRILDAINLLRDQGDKIAEGAAVFGFSLDPDDI